MMRKLRLKDDYGLTFAGFLVSLFTGVIVLTALLVTLAYSLDKKSCAEVTESMNRESYYEFWEGCMVETNDGYFPLDQVRENQ